jgi:hypothetical protein
MTAVPSQNVSKIIRALTLSTLIVSLDNPATPRNRRHKYDIYIYLILSGTDPGMHEPQKCDQTCIEIELPWEQTSE